MKRIPGLILFLAFQIVSVEAQTVSNYVEYGDEDLCNTGTYSTDPKAGATLIGLAPGVVTQSSGAFHHSFPFSPGAGDYPGTDQIYVGHVQTGSHDGYAGSAGRINGPQVITMDYSSLVPPGQIAATFTLGIGADDFQFPSWGQPFTAAINGIDNSVLTSTLNGLNQTGPYEQFLSIGVDPATLQSSHVLTLSIDEGGDGGDGWAIDFLTIGITTVPAALGSLKASVVPNGSGGSALNLTLSTNVVGAILDSTTNLNQPETWTPIWTNSGAGAITLPFAYSRQFFRLRSE